MGDEPPPSTRIMILLCRRRVRSVNAWVCRWRVNWTKSGGGVMRYLLCRLGPTPHCVCERVCVSERERVRECVCVSAWSDSPAVWVIPPRSCICTHACTQTNTGKVNQQVHLHTHTHTLSQHFLAYTTRTYCTQTFFPTLALCVFKHRKPPLCNLPHSSLSVLFTVKSAAVIKSICCVWRRLRGRALLEITFHCCSAVCAFYICKFYFCISALLLRRF